MWLQKEITLKAQNRGFHLVTEEIVSAIPEISQLRIAIVHMLIEHTSASLSLNENADPTVRLDFESVFSRLIPEDEPYYQHLDEGPDDLPAHIKASLLGASVTLPISDGRLRMGIWQGIYLGEHRNYGGSRRVVVTVNGE